MTITPSANTIIIW